MGNYLRARFTDIPASRKEILIAELSEIGFDGFEETDHYLDAFIPVENYNRPGIEVICTEYGLVFTETEIREENWNQLWESNFNPVIVDDFVAVRAHFHAPVPSVLHEIVITPKMSFGTGHHATTNMMMRQMREIDFRDKTVFDFGTGTGILAILAEKLGAASVTAIDNDEWSINNAAENIEMNACSRIHLLQAEGAIPGQAFDIILANITKNIIAENFSALNQQLNKNAILLISGLLENDEAEMEVLSRKYSLFPGTRLKEGNWLCLRFLR